MNKIVLESAKGVAGGKVQLCFSQMVTIGATSANILGALNASDERFAQKKPRFAWLTVQPADAAKEFGIEALATLKKDEELEIGKEDPRMASAPDQELNIRIIETTKGSEYDVANIEKRAKRAGKDGDFILHNGQYIYTQVQVVAGPANHVLIPVEETTRLTSDASSSLISEALND